GARGDLEAFNSEKIARSMLRFNIPIVSGVGHEDDVSLVDLVADKRASTPSNAAEMIFPDSKDLLKEIMSLRHKLASALTSRLRFVEMEVQSLKIELIRSIESLILSLESRLSLAKARLGGLNFEKLFARGYALIESGGQLVKSVEDVSLGGELIATLSDGKLKLEVKDKLKK
ncbi:MAG: exodeoxyribonuclease large subunit, partial [Patescibacteria group bacterium]|nr:exodeoxyribonuclease large subunit [Patescibacteria group bacterium]